MEVNPIPCSSPASDSLKDLAFTTHRLIASLEFPMRWIIGMVALTLSMHAAAQSKRYGDVSYQRPQDCSVITEQNRLNPYAYLFREQCERIDASAKQSMARTLGRPQPSKRVLSVPAHGTEDARRLGVACMSGLVVLRIENGWQQALDKDHRYYTCRER